MRGDVSHISLCVNWKWKYLLLVFLKTSYFMPNFTQNILQLHYYTRSWGLRVFCRSDFELKSWGIDIAESISVSIKVVIACTKEFPDNDIMGIPFTQTIWPPSAGSWEGRKLPFLALGVLVPLYIGYSES